MIGPSAPNENWFLTGWAAQTGFQRLDFLLTVIGFLITGGSALGAFITAYKIKNKINLVANISDLGEVLYVIDEIRRYLTLEIWAVLPDRYNHLRRLLVSIKSSGDLSSKQIAVIEKIIADQKVLEEVMLNNWKTGLSAKNAKSADSYLRNHSDSIYMLSIQTKKKVV